MFASLKPDSDWSQALTGNLPNAKDVECDSIPIMVFGINSSGKYVKLTMDSFYDSGPGLQYVGFEYEEICGKLVKKAITTSSRYCSKSNAYIYIYREREGERKNDFIFIIIYRPKM